MGCGCNGASEAIEEYEVRLPNGQLVIVQGKAAAEMTVRENGGGSIVKKRV